MIRRFQEFEGVGQKISTMAVNILRRDYKIPISDLSSIDISADVHLKRIFKRMGFIKNENKESAIIQARKMNPEFPGIFDYVIWNHGVEVCKKIILYVENVDLIAFVSKIYKELNFLFILKLYILFNYLFSI